MFITEENVYNPDGILRNMVKYLKGIGLNHSLMTILEEMLNGGLFIGNITDKISNYSAHELYRMGHRTPLPIPTTSGFLTPDEHNMIGSTVPYPRPKVPCYLQGYSDFFLETVKNIAKGLDMKRIVEAWRRRIGVIYIPHVVLGDQETDGLLVLGAGKILVPSDVAIPPDGMERYTNDPAILHNLPRGYNLDETVLKRIYGK